MDNVDLPRPPMSATLRNGTPDSERTPESSRGNNLLRELGIDPSAVAGLGRAVNELKDDKYTQKDLADITPPESTYFAIPMVASVIAHRIDSEVPVTMPTQAEIEAMRPWLGRINRFIGRFWKNGAEKFGKYVERRGQQVVIDTGNKIADVADVMRTIEDPKQQFVTELTSLYNHLARPEYEKGEDFLGEHKQELKIEDKIKNLLLDLKYVRDGGDHQLYTRDQYPILTTILPVIKFPPDTLDYDQASIAGSEFMEGIHVFLRQQGVAQLMPIPTPQEVNLFDSGSWMRGIAETFFGEKLERVKKSLPNVLTQVHGLLPASGPQFADKIYGIAHNVSTLSKQGKTPGEIAQSVFRK